MSKRKPFILISLVLMVSFLLGACASAAPEVEEAAGGGLICVIVPGVENPFFGSNR